MEWQLIDTAPKDGTEVDLWRDGERLTGYHYRSSGLSGWVKEHGYPAVTKVLTQQPTHWMPIPKPPEPRR